MGLASLRRLLTWQVRWDLVVASIRRNPLEWLVALGAALRVWTYSLNRSYWLDEGTLANNLDVPIFDFSNHLAGDQLAPFGFLIAERAMVSFFGVSRYVTRFLPLICGLASLVLFQRLARRLLGFQAAVVAVALFALSTDQIYYSSELKPYVCDLAVSLGIMLLAVRLGHGHGTEWDFAGFGLLAVASPWFSFPSSFVIGGCGLALVWECSRRGRNRELVGLLAIGGCWLASAAGAYITSRWLLNPSTSMYRFWDFAFLPMPPASRADLVKIGGILLETFVNPLNLVPSVLPWLGVLLPLGLFVAGAFSLARRDPAAFLCLALPIFLALIAASARRYPFHGRLILYLVPAFLLILAEGTSRVRAKASARVYAVALALLLSYPIAGALYEATSKHWRPFNIHGDLHDNLFMP
jgi:uncharacterized membrane protein